MNPHSNNLLFLSLVAQHAGPSHSVRYEVLRASDVPEQTKRIYNSSAAVLDALVNRKLQALRDNGWIEMTNGTYTILADGKRQLEVLYQKGSSSGWSAS